MAQYIDVGSSGPRSFIQGQPASAQLAAVVVGGVAVPMLVVCVEAGTGQAAGPSEELRQQFATLVTRWKQDTARLSTFERKMLQPSYRRIIGLGRNAAPLVLKELGREPDHWFWALEAMTGENPASAARTFDEAVEAWLRWGREHAEIED